MEFKLELFSEFCMCFTVVCVFLDVHKSSPVPGDAHGRPFIPGESPGDPRGRRLIPGRSPGRWSFNRSSNQSFLRLGDRVGV